jgi:hypothetical protein
VVGCGGGGGVDVWVGIVDAVVGHCEVDSMWDMRVVW